MNNNIAKIQSLINLTITKLVASALIIVLSFSFAFTGLPWQKIDKAEAAGSTFYVSASGTDDVSHGGSIGAGAWKTLDYALTGSRVSHGDTVKIEAGTYDTYNGAHTFIQPVIGGSATTPVTIEPVASGDSVTLNIPNNGTTAFIYFKVGVPTNLHFKNINFTNTHSKNIMLTWLWGHSLTLENSTVDMNLTGQCVSTMSNDTTAASVTYLRTKIQNVGSTYGVVRNTRTDGIIPNLNISSSVIVASTYAYMFDLNKPTNMSFTNNTFSYYTYGISLTSSGGTMLAKNNIFYEKHPTSANGFFRFAAGATAMQSYIDTPSSWDVTNNIWYNVAGNSGLVSNSSSNQTMLLPDDVTNHRIDPSFTDSGNDFSISSSSKICGLGLNGSLISGGDINGQAWTGSDIGAYKCPYATTQVGALANKVAFAGDSIMKANSLTSTAYDTFHALTGVSYADPATSAIPGLAMEGLFGLVDSMMVNELPNTVFVSVGINNVVASNSIVTNQQYADYILSIMQKIENWGAEPIWLGIGTTNGYNGLDDTKVDSVNALVEAGCVTNGWKHGLYLNQFKLNANWQSADPNGYYDVAANVHPNSLGQTIIGQFAERLYSTVSKTIGTDKIDVQAGARIYKDGKFRDVTTNSGVLADLSISSTSVPYATNSMAAFLDISAITWSTTGTYHKTWTETGYASGLTNTIHTVGDLKANQSYTIKVDGIVGQNIASESCTAVLCTTDSQGKITFTYTGTYSEHIFDIDEYVPTPVVIAPAVAEPTPTAVAVATSDYRFEKDSTLKDGTISEPTVQSTEKFVPRKTAILQSVLKHLGYYPSTVSNTGYFGSITKKSLALYQVSKGIIKSIYSYGAGFFGPKTRVSIDNEIATGNAPKTVIDAEQTDFSSKYCLTRDLYVGLESQNVRILQEKLSSLGYLNEKYVTGLFGSITEKAVKQYQADKNINTSAGGSGRVGPITRAALNINF